jgi:hypothetical protein
MFKLGDYLTYFLEAKKLADEKLKKDQGMFELLDYLTYRFRSKEIGRREVKEGSRHVFKGKSI